MAAQSEANWQKPNQTVISTVKADIAVQDAGRLSVAR